MSFFDELDCAPIPKRSSLFSSLGIDEGQSKADFRRKNAFGLSPVGNSPDLERILALPRRARPSDEEQTRMAEIMTARLRRENTRCRCADIRPNDKNPCITRLNSVQGWYLYEGAASGGALGSIAVGEGKTGIGVLLSMVFPWTEEDLKSGRARAVILLQPNLRAQFRADFELWSQHFNTPNLAGSAGPFVPGRPTLDILAYSELSSPACSTWLRANKPKLLIADECHNLKDVTSVRTARFLKHFTQEDAVLCAHSGSLTTRGLDDFAHLSALSLGESSPMPLEPETVREWASALDSTPRGIAAPAGALKKLCEPGESVRSGFRRRFVETRGVITTAEAVLPVKLTIRERSVKTPTEIAEALKLVRNRRKRPDGEELTEQHEVVATARQVAQGFYYFWRFPRGEPEELIAEWRKRRSNWNREVREKMDGRRAELLDSPELLRAAGERFLDGYSGPLPVWRTQHLEAWREIEDKVQPVQGTKWLHTYLAEDAVRWGQQPGIIWYENTAWGLKVAELGGFPFYDGGKDAEIQAEDGHRTIVASIEAHGTGKNLQAFNRALATGSGPSDWEQLLGRLHRQKQQAPEVVFDVYLHTPEIRSLFTFAQTRARETHEKIGKMERLVFAEKHLTSVEASD